MFTRYATGRESDRTIAAWLNAKGARTARDRSFGKDTVREMLCNAAYAGYVSGLRTRAARSRDCTSRSSPRSYLTACRRSAGGAPASSSPARPPRNTYCASCSTASAAAPGCTAPVAPRPLCAATCAPHAATATPAASGSSRQRSLRCSWWTGYATSSRRRTARPPSPNRPRREHRQHRAAGRAARRAARPATTSTRPLCARRPHQGPIRHAPPSA